MNNPKVFISYSWHPEENKIRVEQLARRLMSDGVDVTIDVWSLKDGQDKYVFMEKMVTDTEINKVLIICNQDYAEKADCRKGGVGTESTIMSDEIYSKTNQTKFLPIVFEKGNDGTIYKPHFITTKILCTKGLMNSTCIQYIDEVYVYPKDYFCPIDYIKHQFVI